MSDVRYVTVAKFCELSGYTVDAVDKKRTNGVWLEGVVWIKAPDGRVLISIDGFHAWVERRPGTAAVLAPAPRPASAATGVVAVSELTTMLRRAAPRGRKRPSK